MEYFATFSAISVNISEKGIWKHNLDLIVRFLGNMTRLGVGMRPSDVTEGECPFFLGEIECPLTAANHLQNLTNAYVYFYFQSEIYV